MIKELKLDQFDKREFEIIIFDITMGILTLLEEKHGDDDEFDLGFGVDKKTLQEAFQKGKNEESSKSSNQPKFLRKNKRNNSDEDLEDDNEF